MAKGRPYLYRPGVPGLYRQSHHPERRLPSGVGAAPPHRICGGGTDRHLVCGREAAAVKAIQAEDLCYTYEDGTVALDHITFAAEKGKVTGILGANGAGKSTLFLSLNGVLTPKSGKVLLGGQPVRYDKKGLLELRRRVGIVFQDPDDQLFSADVYRDVSFGGVNLGLPAEEVRRRVEAALERTGVSHLRDKPTHALSYGQKKRVAIAGVLVMEPEVLILDEPTAGLDPQGVSDIMKLLTRLRDELGMTVLIATHDMDIVPLYCDYAYLLGGGKVLLEGTPEQLFADPAALRANHLRLPRIAHLMEVLREVDGLDADRSAATIGAARREILRMLKEENQ
ncbi:energy-coupling factor ABC transporter ATP-binding protein [Flavonifractor sp. An52]|nr:energy-coupling factor ABC transporter ATP-binding protein [Flavonifractor sp. An52]